MPYRWCSRRKNGGAHQFASPASRMNAGTSTAYQGGVHQDRDRHAEPEQLDERHL